MSKFKEYLEALQDPEKKIKGSKIESFKGSKTFDKNNVRIKVGDIVYGDNELFRVTSIDDHDKIGFVSITDPRHSGSLFSKYVEVIPKNKIDEYKRKIRENEVKKEKEIKDDDEKDSDVSQKIYDELERQLKPDVNAIIKKSRSVFNQLKTKYGYKGSIDDFMDDAYGWAGGKNDPEDIRVIETALFGRK